MRSSAAGRRELKDWLEILLAASPLLAHNTHTTSTTIQYNLWPLATSWLRPGFVAGGYPSHLQTSLGLRHCLHINGSRDTEVLSTSDTRSASTHDPKTFEPAPASWLPAFNQRWWTGELKEGSLEESRSRGPEVLKALKKPERRFRSL